MKILVTGGAGFVGSSFIRYALDKYQDWEIINLDKLTYAGNLNNITDFKNNPRHTFVHGDIANKELINYLLSQDIKLIVNFAAETHVDRSIVDPAPFIQTNVVGTQTLLEAAKNFNIQKILHISTPEVYGGSSPLKENETFTENSPFLPNNPYSVSKASADLLCRAYQQTYGLSIMFTRFANVFGPYQYPEKLIPLTITNALRDISIPVYGDGRYRRNWIYILDVCQAIDLIIHKGLRNQAYNIGSGYEMSNLVLVHKILDMMNKTKGLVKFVPDRPAHDWQYPLDSTKIKNELEWNMTYNFDDCLKITINWYKNNIEWWETLQQPDYSNHYNKTLIS